MFRFLPRGEAAVISWAQTPKARLFIQYERRMLQPLLASLAGYRCVQIGVWGNDGPALAHAGTLCQWTLGFDAQPGAAIRFDGRHLPLASASVDALVLSHALERVATPHMLLRDCARVLNARGQLIVLSFNPLSLWYLRQLWPWRRGPLPGLETPPPSASRLFDWLRLLEFEPEQLWRYGLGFPGFGRAHCVGRDSRRMRSIAWSAQAYAVVARRQSAPRTPVRESPSRRLARQPATAVARACSNHVT